MIFYNMIFKQLRNPNGVFGSWVLNGMTMGNNKKLKEWGLSYINVKNDFNILDIGCGAGDVIHNLAQKITEGKTYGIDSSQESIKTAKLINKTEIKNKIVEIREGNVSQLPYANDFFDLVISINSHLFWPDLEKNLHEVLRVVKPNGVFLVITDLYKNKKNDKKYKSVIMELKINYHSGEELKVLFQKIGFNDINLLINDNKSWLCCYGIK